MTRQLTEIIEIIKTNRGYKTDEKVANAIGMSQGNLSNYKSRGTLPLEALLSYCDKNEIDFGWLIQGEKAVSEDDTKIISNVDFDAVLGRIKLYENISDDSEVALALRLSKFALAQRKTRDSLPIDKLREFCDRESININWLLTGLGWTSSPSTWRAFDWMRSRIEHQLWKDVKRIVIVTYYDVDGARDLANGFIIEKSRGTISMGGAATRSGYTGGGPNTYCAILENISNIKVPIGQVKFEDGKAPDWDKIDISSLIARANFNDDIIATELHNVRPDKYPLNANVLPILDSDILEVIEWMKNNPQDKELIVKLIQGRKYTKEALDRLK